MRKIKGNPILAIGAILVAVVLIAGSFLVYNKSLRYARVRDLVLEDGSIVVGNFLLKGKIGILITATGEEDILLVADDTWAAKFANEELARQYLDEVVVVRCYVTDTISNPYNPNYSMPVISTEEIHDADWWE